MFGPEQFGNAGADQRIEIGRLDAIAGQQAIAKIARRPVGVVADQEMIAGFQHREQGRGDRRQARGRKTNAGALRTFDRHQRFLQRLGRRRSVTAILELAAMGMQIVGGRIQHGGTMDDRRVDESFLRLGVAAGRHQRGFRFLRARSFVFRLKNSCVLPPPRICLAAAARLKTAGGGFGLDLLITGHEKTAVNPLTRLASRSVMRACYSVAAR